MAGFLTGPRRRRQGSGRSVSMLHPAAARCGWSPTSARPRRPGIAHGASKSGYGAGAPATTGGTEVGVPRGRWQRGHGGGVPQGGAEATGVERRPEGRAGAVPERVGPQPVEECGSPRHPCRTEERERWLLLRRMAHDTAAEHGQLPGPVRALWPAGGRLVELVDHREVLVDGLREPGLVLLGVYLPGGPHERGQAAVVVPGLGLRHGAQMHVERHGSPRGRGDPMPGPRRRNGSEGNVARATDSGPRSPDRWCPECLSPGFRPGRRCITGQP